MRLATTTADFLKYVNTPAEAVRQFKDTQFRYLDYNFYNVIHPSSSFLTDNWMQDIKDAAVEAEKLDITFVQAHAPNYNFMNPNIDHTEGFLSLVRSIQACEYLGIKNMVLHNGYWFTLRYANDKDEYFKQNRIFFEKLIPYMEKYNVNILVENSNEINMGGCYFLMSAQDIKDFIQYINHPLLHACWDIGHANMRSNDQLSELRILGTDLFALHIADNFGSFDEHMAPFMGNVNMDSIMQGLIDIGYTGYFTFEADNILCAPGTTWPHTKQAFPLLSPPRLSQPSLDLKRKAISLLYEIGKYILEQYDCFEV